MPKILLHHRRLTSAVIRSLHGIRSETKKFFSSVGFDLQSLTWAFSVDTEDKENPDDSSVSDEPFSDIGELGSFDEERLESDFHLFDHAVSQLNPANLRALRLEGQRNSPHLPLPLGALVQQPLPNLKMFYSSIECTILMLSFLMDSAPSLEQIEIGADLHRVFSAVTGIAALSKSRESKTKLKSIAISAPGDDLNVTSDGWLETALDFDPAQLQPAAAYDAYCQQTYGVPLSEFTIYERTLWQSVAIKLLIQPRPPQLDDLFRCCCKGALSEMNALINLPRKVVSSHGGFAFVLEKCGQLCERVNFSSETECRALMQLMDIVFERSDIWNDLYPPPSMLRQAIAANPICLSFIESRTAIDCAIQDMTFFDKNGINRAILLTNPRTFGSDPAAVLKLMTGADVNAMDIFIGPNKIPLVHKFLSLLGADKGNRWIACIIEVLDQAASVPRPWYLDILRVEFVSPRDICLTTPAIYARLLRLFIDSPKWISRLVRQSLRAAPSDAKFWEFMRDVLNFRISRTWVFGSKEKAILAEQVWPECLAEATTLESITCHGKALVWNFQSVPDAIKTFLAGGKLTFKVPLRDCIVRNLLQKLVPMQLSA
jgi:hypothetical protein